jgi:hypothetical protein
MTEFVYHVTTPDRAEKCLSEGLVPYRTTESHPRTLEKDARYDALRPDAIVRTGLTRLNSVYAHPNLDVAARRRNGGWLDRIQGEIAILAIQITDPTKVYVADGLLVAEPHTAPEFWASVTTLENYRKQDEPTFKAPDWAEPYNAHRPDRWRSYFYMWPEVLIPSGVNAVNISIESIIKED